MFLRLAFGLSVISTTALSYPAWAEGDGPLQIIVSKETQSLTVYEGGQAIATSKVSTGKAGHSTPSGVFSILEKRRHHKSNLYSNSPMPYMQRLTWSGIALHESGHVPAYPASHGCIRMPGDFAKTLFQMTARGVHVIVSDGPVTPVPFSHPALFLPVNPVEDNQLLSDAELRPTMPEVAGKRVELAMNGILPKVGATATAVLPDPPPLRILITRREPREIMRDVQDLLATLGFDAGSADGLAGPLTRAAINAFKDSKGLEAKGTLVTPEFLSVLYKAANRGEPPQGKIMVRQKFKPLFEAAIAIREPQIELGTHFLTATRVNRLSNEAEWQLTALENDLDTETRKRLGISDKGKPHHVDATSEALARISIPPDIRHKIGLILSQGTSITISDTGLGSDTGDGTDFITITRKAPRSRTKPG